MKKLSALAVLIPVFGLVVYTLFTTVAKADTSQLPNVPPGYEMVDLITDNGFENSTGGFAVMGSAAEGSVAQTSVNPIQGSKSLSLTVNSYGRVGFGNIFPWEGGPFSDSLTVKAKIRVESGNSGRQLKVCSIAYIQNNNEPLNTCQNFPINNQNVADVYLTQSLSAKQLYMAFFQFSLENSGSVVVTVDDAHLYVVRAQSNTPPPPTPVNGVCGSANGTTVPTIPTTNLCSVGAASSVNGSGPWTWTCAGTNGGTTANCSAQITQAPPTTFLLSVSKSGNGSVNSVPAGISCGSACSASFNSGTSVTLTATAVTGNTFAGWTGACSGTGTCTVSMTAAKSVGANFTANTPNPVNGVCGSANGGTFTSAPTTNLCSVGAASSVNGSGPWTWTCAGTNGGTTASCGAQVQVTQTPPPTELQVPNVPSGYQLVDLLAPDNGFETGKNGFGPFSTSDGSATQTTTNPIIPLKSLKIITNGYGRVGYTMNYPWDGGPIGLTVSVSGKLRVDASSVQNQKQEVCAIAYLQSSGAMLTKCGLFAVSATTINNVYLEIPISNQKLRSVTFQLDSNSGSKMTATLDDAHLYVVQPVSAPTPVNGVCGSANGTTVPTIPTTNLCSVGAASSVNGSGPWTWTCAGTNGGTTANCSAQITQAPPTTFLLSVSKSGNGSVNSVPAGISCGSACSASFNSGTSVTLTATAVTGNTFAGWTGACSGTGTCTVSMTAAKSVGANFTANTPNPVNGVCGSANGGTFTSAPTTNLCSVGAASSVNGSGPWTWTCAGTNGGTTASCGAQVQVTTTPGGGPTHPSVAGNRNVTMMSPISGETFWSTPLNLRMIAKGKDGNVFTNEPTEGHGDNADRVEFYIDGTLLFSENGLDAEYGIFKGFANNINVAPGQHLAWARAIYVNPSLVLDSIPVVINVVAQPTYAQTIELTQNLVLPTNQAYTLTGTDNGRIRVNGNGFTITGNPSSAIFKYVDFYDLGSRTNTGLSGMDITANSNLTLEDSNFDSTNPVSFTLNGSATASVRRNTWRSNTRGPVGQQPYEPFTYHVINFNGNSAATKVFAGNNVGAGPLGFTGVNHWTIGGTTDADSNILIGPRGGIEMQGSSNMTVVGNYSDPHYLDDWSQGFNFELNGASPITVEHNVIIGSSWPIRGIADQFRYNLVVHAGHEFVWPETHARIHHNLFVGGDQDVGGITLFYPNTDIVIENNTFDGQNSDLMQAAINFFQGSAILRSNAFVRIPNNSAAFAAVVINSTASMTTDYNAFNNQQPLNYSDGRVPTHDVTGGNFAGPLPSASPVEYGINGISEAGVWNRQIPISVILSNFRTYYTPVTSNLIDKGDPVGGAGNDIGAVGAGIANSLDLFGTFNQGGSTPPPPTTFTLSTSVSGSGSITSVPAGISCGSACSASFNSGTSVTLTATAVTGNTFAGWTGACSGTGTCTVSMTAAKSVGANFTANTPNPVNGVCGSANGGTFTSAPTTNLCSVGAASSVNGSGPWTWTCAGTNGGTTASCGAQVQTGTTTPGSSLNPTTPNNLYAAGILPNAIYLKWSQSDSPKIPGQSGATIASYRISRDGSQIASVNARTLQFQDTGVAPNTTHSYSVVAVDSGNKVSAAATASASTIPAMPVGSASTHPVLFPAGYIAHLALGGSDWAAMKQSCDSGLNSLVQNSYAGWEWRDAAVLYSTCYTVAKQQGDTTNATKYAKKDLALAKVLAHDSNLGTADPAYQPIGLGNNSQTVFTLPFTPMFPTQVRVSLVTTHEKPVTRTSGHDALGIYAPIMKVSNTSGGANDYASTAYTLDFRDKNGLDADHNGEMDTFNIRWLGATKPNSGATYFVTVADGAVTNLSTGSFSVNGTTLTLNSAPGSSQAVFVSYIGSQYEQTGNGLGGLNSIEPDGPGYQMRTFNPGLATAYDALHDSGLLTPAMMTEFYTILNDQVDWCTDFCFENDGSNGETGNYFVRGLTESTFMTAYATDVENPRATEMKTRANLFVSQIYKGVAKDISDGEWLEGQYANGMINDILQLMSLYNDITHLDLLSSLEWTNNIVPAIIHGTKPGFRSFYDSGDWSPAPATPIDTGLKALRQYLPNNPTAPFAGKLLQELGENPMGSVTDYRNSYPLSFLGKVQSPIFSRSDWSTNAVWMSLASNDVVAAHQHMDAGHIEINRAGKDLLRDAGAYGDSDTLPWHNTIGIDDRGFGNHSVYPPGQAGWWDQNSQITKRMENGLFTYGKADIAPAYTNNDGVSNSVTQGLRSVVFLRPDKIVVFDQIQTANAGVKKIFNLNFGGPLNNQGGIWSTTVGTSTLFMQPLLAPSAAPVTSQLNGQDGIVSTNYQETTSGNTKDVFLHVFQASASSVGSMTTAKLIKSVDRNVQGTEVSANGTLWATLFAAFDRTFGGNVQYALPSAGTHKHLVNDLVPSAAYVVSVTNAQGAVSRTMNVNTDSNGSLTFDSADGETYFYVSVGSTAPTTVPPVNGDPNA